MNAAIRALNGFGLGARPGEQGRTTDPRNWLRGQLDGGAPALAAPEAATPERITEAVRAFRSAAQGGAQARQQLRQQLVAIASAESRLTLTERVTTDRPFVERLVAFWSNHLCVSVGSKVLVAPFAGSYEREAIRPFVLGRFEDMVLASARHPAMLLYLDNFQSVGPRSRAAGGQSRTPRGLNENYARELMELHTLGVNGGYAQQDVQELAKILTGWTVGGLNARPASPPPQQRRARRGGPAASTAPEPAQLGFAFRDLAHEPGPKTLVGARYQEAGVEEGERAIRALCRHPSTSRFVTTKLVAHFVSDTPPPAAVDRIARVFQDTHGDLRAVSAALVDLPEAWTPDARKFRTPQDWLVAVLRAVNATAVNDRQLQILRQLRHPLWSPQAPKGFGDTAQEWADPDSLLNRAELARTTVRAASGRGRVDPHTLLDVVDVARGDPLQPLVVGYLDPRRRATRPRARRRLRSSGGSHESPDVRSHHVLGGIATFGCPVVSFAQVRRKRAVRVRPAARRLRRTRGDRAVRRSRLRVAAHRILVRGIRSGRAERSVRARTGALTASRVLGSRRARRRPRDGDSVPHAQPLRRPGDPRDRARPAGRLLGRLAQSPVAGHVRRAFRCRDRVGDAAVDDRCVRTSRPGRRPSSARSRTSTCERLATLYRTDPVLQGRFEAALQQQDIVGEEPTAGGTARRGGITPLMQATARIMRPDNGPNIAAVEFSGWDTHANQGLAGGPLDRLLGQLADGTRRLPHGDGRRLGATRRSSS